MNEKKRVIYVPKERKSILLRVSSWLFCIGTAVMWAAKDRLGFEKGDLLIMSGIAVLLLTLSLSGIKAERKAKAESEELKRLREKSGSVDYNSDRY